MSPSAAVVGAGVGVGVGAVSAGAVVGAGAIVGVGAVFEGGRDEQGGVVDKFRPPGEGKFIYHPRGEGGEGGRRRRSR